MSRPTLLNRAEGWAQRLREAQHTPSEVGRRGPAERAVLTGTSWTPSLRVRLAVASVGIVAAALLVAAVSLIWLFERNLLGNIRASDGARAAQAVAVELFCQRYPAHFPVGLPTMETGTVLQLIEGKDTILHDSRDDTSFSNPTVSRFLADVGRFTPQQHARGSQGEFERALDEFETCAKRAGLNVQELRRPLTEAELELGVPVAAVEPVNERFDGCMNALDEAFTRASEAVGNRLATSEVVGASGGRYLTTTVAMLRPDSNTTVSAVVATALGDVDQNVETLRNRLVAGVLFVVSLVGIVSWLLVGRSLRPVEAIRREVVAIAHQTLDRRVPEPETQDEVGRLARTMNEMLGRLELAAKVQRQFVSDASHELRNPIASIRTQLEVALTHPAQVDWRVIASDTLVESLRIEGLVEGLLELARMDEQDPTSYVGRREPVDLDDIVFAEARRIQRFRVRTDRVSAGRVRGNSDQLRRVLRNILENAERYARDEIRVELSSTGERVTLAVEDDGPGIPLEQRDRVFERFSRIEASRSRAVGGAGLGLAVARGIVARHAGRISIGNANIGGARFEVSFPELKA